ncbi:hypothetical protein RRG08_062600 [Elysia crispata]|uniref:Uncharacterized protein n=1 Tax=Elysia crispata TaxID=231223 RepID=A0AAE0YYH6_9GAST|nr:hypothetical protein RRG08_062600 [Elysia crispata]
MLASDERPQFTMFTSARTGRAMIPRADILTTPHPHSSSHKISSGLWAFEHLVYAHMKLGQAEKRAPTLLPVLWPGFWATAFLKIYAIETWSGTTATAAVSLMQTALVNQIGFSSPSRLSGSVLGCRVRASVYS